jgi:protein-S-isoprenylcysteine O-methyltransferase Ste14
MNRTLSQSPRRSQRRSQRRSLGQSLSLVLRNVVFTVVVPGLGGAWLPWWLLTHGTRGTTSTPAPAAWAALPVIAAGAALYFWCAWNFATVGGGTPGPWDAPRRVVARGPYRWVRNPIYLAALLVVLGEAWLFASPRLLAYAAVMAACFHLFVTGYEERTLARRFGPAYLEYRRAVPRWIPRKPAYPAGGATTGAGKSRVLWAADGWVSSAAWPSATR